MCAWFVINIVFFVCQEGPRCRNNKEFKIPTSAYFTCTSSPIAHHPLYDIGIYFIFYDDGNSVSIDLLKGSFQNKRSLADNGKLRGFVLRYIYSTLLYIYYFMIILTYGSLQLRFCLYFSNCRLH